MVLLLQPPLQRSTLDTHNNHYHLLYSYYAIAGTLHPLLHLIQKHISKVDIEISISQMRKFAQGHTATKGYSKDLNTVVSKQ